MSPPPPAGHPPRAPASAPGAPRHPAASHPGFEPLDPDDEPTVIGHASALARVLAAVDDGFRRMGELLGLSREVSALREQLVEQGHALELERLERLRLADRVQALEKSAETTGQHQREDVQRELERMRGSQAHWVRYAVGVAIGAVVALLIAALTRRP